MKIEFVTQPARFRAYSLVTLTRKPDLDDHIKRAKEGKPAFKRDDRIEYQGEDVVAEGNVSGAALSIAAGDKVVTRVVLYAGPVESEMVVGSADVGASGTIVCELVEKPAE